MSRQAPSAAALLWYEKTSSLCCCTALAFHSDIGRLIVTWIQNLQNLQQATAVAPSWSWHVGLAFQLVPTFLAAEQEKYSVLLCQVGGCNVWLHIHLQMLAATVVGDAAVAVAAAVSDLAEILTVLHGVLLLVSKNGRCAFLGSSTSTSATLCILIQACCRCLLVLISQTLAGCFCNTVAQQ
jgi:hypothetical protein